MSMETRITPLPIYCVTESLRRPFYTADVDETNLYVEFSCFEQCKIESETIGDSVR